MRGRDKGRDEGRDDRIINSKGEATDYLKAVLDAEWRREDSETEEPTE